MATTENDATATLDEIPPVIDGYVVKKGARKVVARTIDRAAKLYIAKRLKAMVPDHMGIRDMFDDEDMTDEKVGRIATRIIGITNGMHKKIMKEVNDD